MGAPDRVDVLVVGAGQAGLAASHHLRRARLRHVVVDGAGEVGGSWRERWDSLRLFTPATVSALPGLPLSGPDRFPTADAVVAYLQAYARRFALPVALDAPVREVHRAGARLRATVGGSLLEARHVIVASGFHRRPRVPTWAPALPSGVVQLTSASYRNPAQLPAGPVLVVGAGNSGAEIAVDVAGAGGRRVVLAGRDVGRIPPLGAPVFRAMRHLRTDVGLGRWVVRAAARGGDPLGRVDPRRFAELGVERRTGRVTATDELTGVAAVIWCTGLDPDLSWLAPELETDPAVHRLGRPFATTMASHLLGGVGGDAARLVRALERS